MKVALESTVITHGLPYPDNVRTALALEKIVRDFGGEPLTIAVIAGQVRIGLTPDEIERFAKTEEVFKAGVRELPVVIARGQTASTTVSATARLASLNGAPVFATGGIGGVHPGRWDVSQDLYELARTPEIVVCAGPKAILDLPGTAEMLETLAVTVVGYQTSEMPAFYTRKSGVSVPRVDNPQAIAVIYMRQRELQLPGAVLVFNPIPVEFELAEADVEHWTALSNTDLKEAGVTGKEVTPFLLSRMAHHSKTATVRSNLGLLENNVRLACQISAALDQDGS
jgi:pseudouridine-5'-phosphate glycosidase